jgi:type VI secretion system protein ImpF
MFQPLSQQFSPGLFDRLIDEHPQLETRRAPAWTLDQLKDAVARDLEALFNTRAALPAGTLDNYPAAAGSVLSYGLVDFAGMCLGSEDDKKAICAAVRQAVDRHEARLYDVCAELRVGPASINRLDLLITCKLRADPAAQPVRFDAELKPSSQRYAIRRAGVRSDGDA